MLKLSGRQKGKQQQPSQHSRQGQRRQGYLKGLGRYFGILKASEGAAKLWGKLRNRLSGKVQSLAVRKMQSSKHIEQSTSHSSILLLM